MYATAMLLSRLGKPTTRQQALALFGIGRPFSGYTGTELTELVRILRSNSQLSDVRWRFLKRFGFEAIRSRLRQQLKATGFPTLLWFGAVDGARSLRAFHIVLVVDVTRDRILLLDSLGRPPARYPFNVCIRQPRNDSRLLDVEGSFYAVDPGMGAAILHCRRPRLAASRAEATARAASFGRAGRERRSRRVR